jgi:hypothetical protein
MISIGKYIYHKLSGVTATVNPLIVPSGSTEFIAFKRKYINPEYDAGGLSYNTTGVQIDVVSTNYINAINMAEQVRELLECKGATFKNIVVQNCILASADESTDGSLYVQSLTFEFFTN